MQSNSKDIWYYILLRFDSSYMNNVDIQLEMKDGIVVDSTVDYQGQGKYI